MALGRITIGLFLPRYRPSRDFSASISLEKVDDSSIKTDRNFRHL